MLNKINYFIHLFSAENYFSHINKPKFCSINKKIYTYKLNEGI